MRLKERGGIIPYLPAFRRHTGQMNDKYISYLLEAVNQTVVVQAASASFGYDAAQMNKVFFSIFDCNDKGKEHAFYDPAKAYINAHPLPFQEEPTKLSIYGSLLAGDYLKLVTESYQRTLEDAYSMVADVCDLRDLFYQICSLLGEENLLSQRKK